MQSMRRYCVAAFPKTVTDLGYKRTDRDAQKSFHVRPKQMCARLTCFEPWGRAALSFWVHL